MGTKSEALQDLAKTVVSVAFRREDPKVITIDRARKCCEQAQQLILTETLNYANSLVRAIFEPPQIRQAGFALRLEIPPALISILRASNVIPVEFTPTPPLRIIMPGQGDLASSFFEADIPSDPTFETFTSLMTAVAYNLQKLGKARNKKCMELNGLNPSNPRRWVSGGHQSRKG